VGIILSGLMQDINADYPVRVRSTSSQDLMVMRWTLISRAGLSNMGEGENPEQWYKFMSGSSAPGRERCFGDAHSRSDTECLDNQISESEFYGSEFSWLCGKKMKITAEDFAGNRSSGITDFLEQAIFLDTWDKEKIVVKPVMAGGIIWNRKFRRHRASTRSKGTRPYGYLYEYEYAISAISSRK